jgi:mono/diheme cytochrome c family protein
MSNNGEPKKLEYHHEVREDRDLHELHAPIMREKQEPRDGFEPVPPFFAPLFGGLIFWAGFFFALKFYDFRPDVLSEEPPQTGPPKVLTLAEKGEAIFQGSCLNCHGPGGIGAQCPPLQQSEWLEQRSPGVVVRILLHGASGPIQVKGKTYDGNMKVDLTDAQIAAAATFVRNAFGNTPRLPGDITEDYVKAARKNTAGRTAPWTASELAAIHDDFLDAPLGTGKADEKDKPADKK